jgi:hypothetical protein
MREYHTVKINILYGNGYISYLGFFFHSACSSHILVNANLTVDSPVQKEFKLSGISRCSYFLQHTDRVYNEML